MAGSSALRAKSSNELFGLKYVQGGTGSAGTGAGVSSTIPMVQGDLTAGLTFRLGE
ncbi:MAG: hypothetical protein IH947_02215 [Bacteroidetes bacterium]|nr:hypothetical protein [Bacteroidota bacterium]